MRINDLSHPRLRLLCLCVIFIPIVAWTQTPSPQSRIVERVSDSALVTLRGNTHPLAQPQFDQGAAPLDLPMARMLLVLKRSDAQESALQKLLDDQQDQSSPSYHQWLTPDQFGQQFGPSDQDIQTVAAWLGLHGFQVGAIGRGRTVIEFSGTASQVQQAFHTEIHKFVVNGEQHWANARDPQIPAALLPVVAGVDSLHNFSKKPMHHVSGVFSKSRATGQVQALQSDFTYPDSSRCANNGNCYLVGPHDFAKIYNVLPLWNATPAIDGTGQSIAIVAVSNINIQDVRDFRNLFGLPAGDPQVILDGPDPGLVPDAETEADLDVEWSGAVAKGATIILVPVASTNAIDGVDLSAVYIIENNLASILSESFGDCELFLGTAGNSFADAIREQAAAQGITFINSSGDEGVARCDPFSGTAPSPATHGFTVNGLASSPHDVAVGGTDFANFTSASNINAPNPYWSSTNDPTQASALGYVPETTWNSNCTNNILVLLGWGANAEAVCNNSNNSITQSVETIAGGGGKSNCITSDGANTSSCGGGYAKPSWQAAPGVPQDGARDIPDVSLFASGGFMDSAYVICEADQPVGHGSCGLTSIDYNFLTVGGTSASAPAFAGIMALVNQYTKSAGQGNANYVLYKLASSSAQRSSSCNATGTPANTCIFNDVTAGTIDVPCAVNTPSCSPSSGHAFGVIGYSAGAGYDLATGLGSVNAFNLVHGWNPPAVATTTTLEMNNGGAVNITHGQSVPVNISVSPSAATGDVVLIGSPTTGSDISMGAFTLQNGSVTGTTATLAGSGGTSYQVRARYAGNGTYDPSDSSPVTVMVGPEPSNALITIPIFDPATGKETGNTPTSLVYGSPYIARMDVANKTETVTFPMKPLCAPLSCPTGSVTLTDSAAGGTTLGVFPLNLLGFADYLTIQLAGGTHQLTASYPGDNSYKSSTGGYSLTVKPAPTTTIILFPISSAPAQNVTIGQPFNTATQTVANSSGVAPTGTFTVLDGTVQIGSTGPLTGFTSSPQVFLNGNFQATLAAPSGPHTITAQYSGDGNYGGSASSTLVVNALYATGTAVSVNPKNVIYGQNTSVTITATVSTGQPASNAALKPTGTVSFGVTGTVTTATGQDASGNWTLQATITTIPQQSGTILASYSGDSNYASSSQWTSLTVTIPDFNVSVSSTPLAVTAGQTGSTTITITPTTNYTSTVALSCYGVAIAGAPCSFSPASVTLSNGASATSTLSFTVPAGSTNLTAMVSPRVRLTGPSAPSDPGFWWTASGTSIFVSLLLLVSPRRCQWPGSILGLFCIGVAGFAIGCASGGSGGGGGAGGGGGGGPVGTATSLASTSAKIAPGASATLTATVKSSNAVTGYVNFNDASFPGVIAPYVNVVNGGAQAQMTNTGSLSADPGTHAITAAYSGDGNDQPSQSGILNIVVTGTRAVLVVGQTGVDTHTAELNVTIQ